MFVKTCLLIQWHSRVGTLSVNIVYEPGFDVVGYVFFLLSVIPSIVTSLKE